MGTAEDRLEMLFVHPDARGMGVGNYLLQHAIQNQQVRKVDVNEQNAQAVGFYLHAGFVLNGRSPVDGAGKPYPLLHLELKG